MGKDRGKKEAERQARQREAELSERLAAAEKPTPVQSFLDQENLDFLEASSGRRGPLDVLAMPGMSPYAAQFAAESAEEQAGQERMGEGLVTMGSAGADPNLSALVRQNRADRRRQTAGANLARNYAAKNAEVRNSVLPLMSLTQNRNLSLASLATQRAESATERDMRRRMQPGVWDTFAGNFAGSLGSTLGSLGRPSGGGWSFGGG
jgi:hypothetical protein